MTLEEYAASVGTTTEVEERKARNLAIQDIVQSRINKFDQMKKDAIAFMGGACKICGYDRHARALEFHHVNPWKKRWNISTLIRTMFGGTNNSSYEKVWQTVKSELQQTVLLCSNCHREVEAGFVEVPPALREAARLASHAI